MSNNFEIFTGIAVEDKQLQSRELKIHLRELTPFVSGKLKDTTRDEKYTVKSEDGTDVSGKVNTSNCVTADYFGMDTNSTFPPDIVKGEQVLVLRYADEDKYYWLSTGRDDNLRKTEIVRWSASNDTSDNKKLTEANTYFAEIDTKLAKRIRLHTSKSNGEDFGYDLIIDAANNFFTIHDDTGNRIDLQSKEKRIKLTTTAGTTVNLDDRDITMLAPGDITIRCGGELTFAAPSIKRQGPVEGVGDITNKGDFTFNGTGTSSGTITAPLFIGNLQGSDGD